VRTLLHPAADDLSLPVVLHALSDPARLAVVRQLAHGVERHCYELDLGLSKATCSYHFRVLREAGITHTRTIGKHHCITLRQQDLDARFPGLLEVILAAAAAPSKSSRRLERSA
jgi:DNA-binding transcriptional ArsR family regulator